MTDQGTVRTRVAPSPTGAPHVGTAYIALFNYAFAKHSGGQFLLRIEDTDQSRSTSESEAAILEALRWTGLAWDEGPDVGGPRGPYRQSERLSIYREHVDLLVEKGAAYPCFCTAERLAELRKEQAESKVGQGYDGRCSRLSAEESRHRIAAGEAHVIRMRVPDEGECVFEDRLRGEIRIPWAQVDQQVLLKSDGFPTYHLAVVVDDHLMGISHVIRGEEWISSTPKHVLLYKHFGWDAPQFVHLPLLRNPDKSKLSKRKNPTGILYYRQAGYLPEALVNFLGLMAYSMPDGKETFTLDQLVATFDIDRVSLGGPVFDLDKLRSFNGRYIRELDPNALWNRLHGWLLNDEQWKKALSAAQPRLQQLSDFVPMTAFLFSDRLQYDATELIPKDMDGKGLAELIKKAQWELEELAAWSEDALKALFANMCEVESMKLKELMLPFFVAISGSAVSLPVFTSMAILGREMTLRRLQHAIEALDGIGIKLSNKRVKELLTEYIISYGDPV